MADLPASTASQERLPEVGALVHVRSRRWLVEGVDDRGADDASVVRLACVEDDAQGQALEVFWQYELDRKILEEEGWRDLATKGFDPPKRFSAFLHTLRWGCVTATDPTLFQAPFRAGITIEAYQMEPLRKALLQPRVSLFIADDTGLGKTIEAGLIARELLLRKKAKYIVVAAPPSVLEQWKAELEERFGLVFVILDRLYLSRIRRERGFGVNPWRTHSRFLISHNLLIDPNSADPMREWLGGLLAGSLLILDEAHHAAPASGGRFGIESKFTRAVRGIAHRFEHRLFLSATPHNGHSHSFSALLELLDPYRFTRGVKVRGTGALKDVMVRRLKEDIRAVQGGFPYRRVEQIVIGGLAEDAPELVLSRLLDEYRTARESRYEGATARVKAASGLLVVGLQQRLLSSIEAFARSLKVHRETVKRQWKRQLQQDSEATPEESAGDQSLLTNTPGADDELGEWEEQDLDAEEQSQIKSATERAEAAARAAGKSEFPAVELELLDQMERTAEASRHLPDAKTRRLIDWIRENMCPGMPTFGDQLPTGAGPPEWNERRVLIFTENRAGTKRHLQDVLDQAIEDTSLADERIEVIDGPTSAARRKEIQRRFNADPKKDPLRILLATDAAREGLNFQAHCADLFHFDLPWNPGRIEQRNGRIDRKLQLAEEVRCHYFTLPQRAEDRVLQVLVQKTATIKKELGSLSKVIDDDVERKLRDGIRHRDADRIAQEIENADLDETKKRIAEEELESARGREEDLRSQNENCRRLLQKSRHWVRFDEEPFREALSSSLELIGADPLKKGKDEDDRDVWTFPPLDGKVQADPSWSATLDTLRPPRRVSQKLAEWRRDAPIRPVVFKDAGALTDEVVQLHLEQRVAQRLLARFRSQGFVHHDLSRACLVQARDSTRRVILLARLSLYGRGAERLHEEIVPLTARWVEPSRRNGGLKSFGREGESTTMDLLDESLTAHGAKPINESIRNGLLASSDEDVAQLRKELERRAKEIAGTAKERLRKRGEVEARSLRQTLERQRDRVRDEIDGNKGELEQLRLGLDRERERELEANMRHWEERLGQFNSDLEAEPERVRQFYEVAAERIEPVGLVYLWPDTN